MIQGWQEEILREIGVQQLTKAMIAKVIFRVRRWQMRKKFQQEKYTIDPGQSNLSQQYENDFWSKMIFEQKKSKNA